MARRKRQPTADRARSWRSIPQETPHKPYTGIARWRRWKGILKVAGLVALVVGLFGGIGWCIFFFTTQESEVKVAVPSRPIAQIQFQTDGVLSESWLKDRLSLDRGTTLMEADIFSLKRALEREGQVRGATIERRFPDTLLVRLQEHQPVLRIGVEAGRGRTILLVAPDGSVYRGVGYPDAALRSLPFLLVDGLKRHPDNPDRYAPVSGIPRVAELLQAARLGHPELYTNWRVVDCRDFDGDPDRPGAVIRVRSRLVAEIVFKPHAFGEQLSRLAEILTYTHSGHNGRPTLPLQRIDLSLDGPAVVEPASPTRSS
ncbi:MAG: cell division protein FtsQ/DivIB [Opitutales bacterium]